MLKGKKVLLRPLKKSDCAFFVKWMNDPEITQYLTLYLPLTELEEEKWFENLATGRKGIDVVFAIEDIKSKKLIGNCGLHKIDPKNHDAILGIAIGDKKYHGRGYGTEAATLLVDYGFNQLNLHRIGSSVYDFNLRSLNLHKLLGFRQEGRLRKKHFKNGKFHDEIFLGLLKEEWKK